MTSGMLQGVCCRLSARNLSGSALILTLYCSHALRDGLTADARALAVQPELEASADGLAAPPPEDLLDRREFVDTCRERNRAGGERPVRRHNVYTATTV